MLVMLLLRTSMWQCRVSQALRPSTHNPVLYSSLKVRVTPSS